MCSHYSGSSSFSSQISLPKRFSVAEITIYRVSILTRHNDIVIMSVRLSVRCVPVYYGNGLIYCHNFFTTWQPNHSSFMGITQLREILMKSPPCWTLNICGELKFRDFRPISHYISQTIQDSAIVTIEGEQKTTSELSNGTSFNDPE